MCVRKIKNFKEKYPFVFFPPQKNLGLPPFLHMLSPTLNYSLTKSSHDVQKACKTLMALLHQNLCGVPKKGTSPSHFLAGPTFVPLWVSHKLKTNPILFFSLFLLFSRRGESDGKTDFAPIFEVCPAQQRVENSAFSHQKKKTAFLRSLGLRYSPTFSPMAIPFWDGHAWEVFSSLPGFCLAISIPLSEKQTPKWQFSRLFFGWQKRFFSSSSE